MVGAQGDGSVRVIIADDEPDIRLMVGRLLRQRTGWEVVGEAADGAAAVEQARLHQPDVLVLDLSMPLQRGEEALPHILAVAPRCMVAVFSGADPLKHRERLLSLGAFSLYDKMAVSDGLAERLATDYERFQQMLSGEATVPVWLERTVNET